MNKRLTAEMLPRDDTVEVIFPDETMEDLTAADKAANAVVEELSSNAEKGKVINIYKQTGTGQESMAFVLSHPADKYSIPEIINQLKADYGGGDYRFMIRNEKGKIIANKLISIAKKLDLNTNGNQNGVYGVLEKMMDKQDQFMQRVLDTQNQGDNNRTEMIKEMIMMKELFSNGQPSSPMGQMKDMFEMMALLKEQANPEKEESGGFAKMITEALPLFNTMAQAAQNQPQQQPQRQPNPQRRTRQPKEQDMQKIAIKQLLSMTNQEPADVAEKLSREVPEAFIPQIEALVLGDDAYNKIKAINPQVEAHKEWFLDVIEWLKGYLGHPCKYDAEFNSVDSDSEKDHNLANTTNEQVNRPIDEASNSNKPDDGNSQRESGDISHT